MIEVSGISKFYGTFKALDNVSFHVDRGEVLGFLGPNGAGKSTTMKILTTYISATEGTARVDGHDVHVFPLEVRRRIGYLPETPPLYADMTVQDYLRFAGRARGLSGRKLKSRLAQVVSECGLEPKLKSRVTELSKGFKQRTGLAQALIHDPDVLILDEPTSGLDPMQIIGIRKLIGQLREGRCLIFSTHILQEAAAVADRLVIVNGGRKIADGTPDELAAKATDSHRVQALVRGEANGLSETIGDVDGVSGVEVQAPRLGYTRVSFAVNGDTAAMRRVCENVSRLVSAHGLMLAELAPVKLSLEEVFLNLLKRGQEAAQAEEAGKEEAGKEEGGEKAKGEDAKVADRQEDRPREAAKAEAQDLAPTEESDLSEAELSPEASEIEPPEGPPGKEAPAMPLVTDGLDPSRTTEFVPRPEGMDVRAEPAKEAPKDKDE